MRANKLIIWTLALLVCVGTASAAITDGLVTYYSHDDSDITGTTSIDSQNANNATYKNSPISVVDGIIYQALSFDSGDDDALTFTTNGMPTANNMTVSMWVKPNTTIEQDGILMSYSNTMDFCFALYGTSNELLFGPNANRLGIEHTNFTADVWNHLVVIYNGVTPTHVYIGGVEQTMSVGGSYFGVDGNMLAARDPTNVDFPFNGDLDEVGIWNRELNQTEITLLATGYNPLAESQPNTTLALTAVDDFNGTSITSFSVNATWANGTTETWSTTTGTYTWGEVRNASTTINLTFWNVTDYYDYTVNSVVVTANTSNAEEGLTYQAVLNLFAREIISNNSVSSATFYVGTNSTSQRFNITADTHTVVFTHSNYYNLSDGVTTTALTTTNHTISGVYSSIVNITLFYSNGTVVTNWGLNITSNTYTNWTGEQGTTTNGSYFFYGINDTYTILVNSSFANASFGFTIDDTTENISLYYFGLDNCSAFTQTVLNLTILNELDDSLLNDSTLNIWVNATSDFLTNDLQFNFTFDTGNYYRLCVPNNTISTWTINAQAEYSNIPTYAEKNYWFVNYPLNSSPTNVNLYLTNSTTQVRLQLRDYNDDEISDAYIRVLSYDLGTNSYRTTEIVKTDSEGDAYAQIVQNTAWYAFLIEYNGEVILQTLPTKITSSTLTLRANLDTDYFASYDVVQGVTTDMTYTNATTTFSFTWSDPTGNMAQGCLRLKRQSINGETLLNTSCETSTAATILMTIPESVGTNTYQADGYIVVSGQSFAVETLSTSFNTTYRTFGLSGIFFSMLIILVLVMVGLWHPAAAIVLMTVGVVFTNVMGIFYLNWTYIITFVILATLTIYRTGKSD